MGSYYRRNQPEKCLLMKGIYTQAIRGTKMNVKIKVRIGNAKSIKKGIKK